MFSYTPLIVLFPLLGFLVLGLFGRKIKNETLLGVIGSGTVGLSLLVAAYIFVTMLGLQSEERKHIIELFAPGVPYNPVIQNPRLKPRLQPAGFFFI